MKKCFILSLFYCHILLLPLAHANELPKVFADALTAMRDARLSSVAVLQKDLDAIQALNAADLVALEPVQIESFETAINEFHRQISEQFIKSTGRYARQTASHTSVSPILTIIFPGDNLVGLQGRVLRAVIKAKKKLALTAVLWFKDADPRVRQKAVWVVDLLEFRDEWHNTGAFLKYLEPVMRDQDQGVREQAHQTLIDTKVAIRHQNVLRWFERSRSSVPRWYLKILRDLKKDTDASAKKARTEIVKAFIEFHTTPSTIHHSIGALVRMREMPRSITPPLTLSFLEILNDNLDVIAPEDYPKVLGLLNTIPVALDVLEGIRSGPTGLYFWRRSTERYKMDALIVRLLKVFEGGCRALEPR